MDRIPRDVTRSSEINFFKRDIVDRASLCNNCTTRKK